MLRTSGLIAGIVMAGLLLGEVRCPEDGMAMYFTGETKVASGGWLLKLYRCPQGHEFWFKG